MSGRFSEFTSRVAKFSPSAARVSEEIHRIGAQVSMLPGVELARRRRVHHSHEAVQHLTAMPRPSVLAVRDESAAIARQRLEEKLRRFISPPASSSPSSSSLGSLILMKARRESYFNGQGADKEMRSSGGCGGERPGNGEIKRKSLKKVFYATVAPFARRAKGSN